MRLISAALAMALALPACAFTPNSTPEKSYTLSVDGPLEGLELRLLSRMQEICGSRADEARERLAGRPAELRRDCIAKLRLEGDPGPDIRAAFERAKAKL